MTGARLGLAALAAGALLAGCDPEIGGGTYYCGPERACPEDLRCDEASALCVFPQQVEAFDCGAQGNIHEPDDVVDDAFALGAVGCDGVTVQQVGCVDNAGDVDYLVATTPNGCTGDVRVQLWAPVAFMPITVDLLDDAGAVVAAGAVCVDVDDDGEQQVCLSASVADLTGYQLRIQRADGGDCDGACAYNRYDLAIY